MLLEQTASISAHQPLAMKPQGILRTSKHGKGPIITTATAANQQEQQRPLGRSASGSIHSSSSSSRSRPPPPQPPNQKNRSETTELSDCDSDDSSGSGWGGGADSGAESEASFAVEELMAPAPPARAPVVSASLKTSSNKPPYVGNNNNNNNNNNTDNMQGARARQRRQDTKGNMNGPVLSSSSHKTAKKSNLKPCSSHATNMEQNRPILDDDIMKDYYYNENNVLVPREKAPTTTSPEESTSEEEEVEEEDETNSRRSRSRNKSQSKQESTTSEPPSRSSSRRGGRRSSQNSINSNSNSSSNSKERSSKEQKSTKSEKYDTARFRGGMEEPVPKDSLSSASSSSSYVPDFLRQQHHEDTGALSGVSNSLGSTRDKQRQEHFVSPVHMVPPYLSSRDRLNGDGNASYNLEDMSYKGGEDDDDDDDDDDDSRADGSVHADDGNGNGNSTLSTRSATPASAGTVEAPKSVFKKSSYHTTGSSGSDAHAQRRQQQPCAVAQPKSVLKKSSYHSTTSSSGGEDGAAPTAQAPSQPASLLRMQSFSSSSEYDSDLLLEEELSTAPSEERRPETSAKAEENNAPTPATLEKELSSPQPCKAEKKVSPGKAGSKSILSAKKDKSPPAPSSKKAKKSWLQVEARIAAPAAIDDSDDENSSSSSSSEQATSTKKIEPTPPPPPPPFKNPSPDIKERKKSHCKPDPPKKKTVSAKNISDDVDADPVVESPMSCASSSSQPKSRLRNATAIETTDSPRTTIQKKMNNTDDDSDSSDSDSENSGDDRLTALVTTESKKGPAGRLNSVLQRSASARTARDQGKSPITTRGPGRSKSEEFHSSFLNSPSSDKTQLTQISSPREKRGSDDASIDSKLEKLICSKYGADPQLEEDALTIEEGNVNLFDDGAKSMRSHDGLYSDDSVSKESEVPVSRHPRALLDDAAAGTSTEEGITATDDDDDETGHVVEKKNRHSKLSGLRKDRKNYGGKDGEEWMFDLSAMENGNNNNHHHNPSFSFRPEDRAKEDKRTDDMLKERKRLRAERLKQAKERIAKEEELKKLEAEKAMRQGKSRVAKAVEEASSCAVDSDDSKSTSSTKQQQNILRRTESSSASFFNTKALRPGSIEQRRELAYQWYTRCGMPNQKSMKDRIKKIQGCDITEEDVDLLPWMKGGYMVNIGAMMKLMTSK